MIMLFIFAFGLVDYSNIKTVDIQYLIAFSQVMKALCYSTKLISGLYATSDPDLAKRFATFSSKISGARATLRLIDDIPMLQYTLEYGLGSKVGLR